MSSTTIFLGLFSYGAGYLFGNLTRDLRTWKVFVLLFLGGWLYLVALSSESYQVLFFVLGMASHHFGRFVGVVLWARSLSDIVFGMRYRKAFDDIRRREQELEERERRLKEAELRQSYQQQEQGQRARAGWQQEAKGFRQKPDDTAQGRSSGNGQSGSSQSQGKKQRSKTSYTPPPQSDVRARHLETLGLKPGRDYSPDDIKKAYRRKVMKVHPDAGGSQVDFIAVQNAYEWLTSHPS